ncbi:MAG: tetratricopeptide repeat protein [Gammaproteobacteria bacterium]|nr:tetratricopeptide repeat protein [Gammaproteobacteria bacterium]
MFTSEALAYFWEKELEESPQVVERKLKEDSVSLSKDTLSHLLIAEIAGQRDELSLSSSEYLKLAKKTKESSIAKRATQIALYAADLKSASAAARIWASASPNDIEAQHILTILLLKTNQERETLTPLHRALIISTGPGMPVLQFSQFIEQIVLEVPGQSEALDATLQKLKKKMKENKEVLLAIATRALSRGEWQEAREAAQQVLSADPLHAEAVFLKARSYLGQNNIAEALSVLSHNSEKLQSHYGIQTLYAKTLLKISDFKRAEVQYTQLLKQYPHDINLLLGMTLIKIEQGQFSAAEKWIQQAGEEQPSHPVLKFYKGYLAQKRGQDAVALKQYLSLLEENKMFVVAIQASVVLGRQKKFNEALALLDSITTADDAETVQLIITKASLYRGINQSQEALTLLNTAIKNYPEYPELLYTRALVSEKLGDLEQVEQDFKMLLKFNPMDVEILNALGYVLADKTDRYEEALEFIHKAFQQKPNDPSVLDSMGWVHYRLKRLEEALGYLKKAYQMAPQPEIAGHLGEVLWVMGQKTEANSVWKKALQHDPENVILKATIQKWKTL